ncbi:DUF6042 family protein [Streptomyces sp. NPDC127084]
MARSPCPVRLEAHRRFRLVMDWEHFHENRIQVSRG